MTGGDISTDTLAGYEPRVLRAKIGPNNVILGYDDVTEQLLAASEGFMVRSGDPC